MREPIDMHAISYRLWRQALSGDQEGALLELEGIDLADMSVLSADLLARLYVRTGRLAEARILWEAILRADPTYSPAAKALNKLNSSWWIRAVVKKYSARFGGGVLLLLALYGLGTMLFAGKDSSFAFVGMAAILALFGIYLVGLFGWAYTAAESLFGFHAPLVQPDPTNNSQHCGIQAGSPPERK